MTGAHLDYICRTRLQTLAKVLAPPDEGEPHYDADVVTEKSRAREGSQPSRRKPRTRSNPFFSIALSDSGNLQAEEARIPSEGKTRKGELILRASFRWRLVRII